MISNFEKTQINDYIRGKSLSKIDCIKIMSVLKTKSFEDFIKNPNLMYTAVPDYVLYDRIKRNIEVNNFNDCNNMNTMEYFVYSSLKSINGGFNF